MFNPDKCEALSYGSLLYGKYGFLFHNSNYFNRFPVLFTIFLNPLKVVIYICALQFNNNLFITQKVTGGDMSI